MTDDRYDRQPHIGTTGAVKQLHYDKNVKCSLKKFYLKSLRAGDYKSLTKDKDSLVVSNAVHVLAETVTDICATFKARPLWRSGFRSR